MLCSGKLNSWTMASRKAATETKRRKLNSEVSRNMSPTASSVCCISSIGRPQSPVSTRGSFKAAAARSTNSLGGSGLGTGPTSEQVNAGSKTSDLTQVREVPETAVARLDSSAAPAQANTSCTIRTIDGLVTGRLVKRYKRFLADIQVSTVALRDI